MRAAVFDSDGGPVQQCGVTEKSGLYFVVMPWMPEIKSGTLVGVGESAVHVVTALSAVHA